MATYFHHGNSEIQSDGLQTLYLMNPNFIGGYSDNNIHPQQQNMLFLNSHVPPPPSQHFVGIPLPAATTSATFGSASSDDPGRQSMHNQHEIIPAFTGLAAPRLQQNRWGSNDHASDMDVFRRPPTQQGLSLSLSSEQPGFRPPPPVGEGSSSVSNGVSNMHGVVLGSKYLKVAQQLLDEVVSVGDELKIDAMREMKDKTKLNNNNTQSKEIMLMSSSGETSSGGKRKSELTIAEKQEFQMKKAKLISMLDEVEQKYRQYHQQMQIVVNSFEQAAGLRSAKSYTSIALQTISKQFRCLKDAISAQIKATCKSLGEEDCLTGKVDGSRLKFVDHQLRQQRALQQLGMMQQNAWRPQRGLPEKAVSVLRAWLFEHFLHPYPKDSDKVMLAKQTGLTRSQVSNWFINARVRLWKPMVEEMYTEEFKEQEQNGEANKQSDQTKSSTTPKDMKNLQLEQMHTLDTKQEQSNKPNVSSTTTSTFTMSSAGVPSLQGQASFNSLISTPKRSRNKMQNSPSSILSMDMEHGHDTNKGINERFNTEFITGTSSRFGAYPLGGLGRFSPEQLATGFPGNNVSLSLSLPHSENMSFSGNQHNFLSNQNIQFGTRHETEEMQNHYNGINNILEASHPDPNYENMNIQNKKRFATQLLQNFVT